MLFIANAKAGTADTDTVERAAEILRTGGPVTVVPGVKPADLDTVLDKHDDETVVVAGGDGSIHAMVQALHRRGELADRAVGLVPLGTGNDLARNVGISLDAEQAARQIVAGTPRAFDLLVADTGAVAVNAVHLGIGAAAAEAATRFKPVFRTAAFPMGSVLAGLRCSGWWLRVEADGELLIEDRLLMVAIGNASGIAGGNAQIAPGASPRDGRLDLMVSAATGPLARVGFALRLRQGRHATRDDVVHKAAEQVTISGDPIGVNADGEVSGPVTRSTWSVAPRAWRLVLPSAEGA